MTERKPPSKNIELKARCRDLKRAARTARAAGARRVGLLHQVDTYFHVRWGRLKLRELRDASVRRAELIAYRRPDRAAARVSEYFIIPVADANAVKSALDGVLGTRAVVAKRRELWMYHNVRIHLDRVDGLGEFVEFEAVIGARNGPALSRKRLDALCKAMRIERSDQLAHSYVDMREP
jgi:predicted adenylyl cyclase CyaB